jgi:hypothetical protein
VERTEERPAAAVPGVFQGSTSGGVEPRPAWLLPAGAVVVALVLGLVIGRGSASSSSDDDVDDGPRAAEEVLAPGALLGSIDGTSRYRGGDVDRYRYAWPGQILTAPEPATGEAVSWQWETCEVPAAPDEEGQDPAPLECTAVDTATDETWESPPTNAARLVRALVTVDLGDQVQVQAASTPVAALPWPEDVTPGDPPPETTPALLTSPPPAR